MKEKLGSKRPILIAVSLVAVSLRREEAFITAPNASAHAYGAVKLGHGTSYASHTGTVKWNLSTLGCLGVLAGVLRRSRVEKMRRQAQSDISQIDFRVGEIKSCEKHPDSDKLLVEQIDVGEEAPRQICSGIGQFFKPDEVVGRKVVIVSNLKARKMAGTSSEGMLLCASQRDGDDLSALDLVEAPEGAPVGERVIVELADEEHGDAAPPNKVGKKKLYEKVAGDLKTNAEGSVCFKDSPFMTSAGPCTAKLTDSVVS